MTILIASLNILSPKTIAYKFASAFISLKIARTETGSVAEIKEPYANDSFKLNLGLKLNGVKFVEQKNITDVLTIAMKVPKKLYINTVPMFLKKGPFCMLYPLSKIIGGRRRIMNKLLK